MSNSNDAIDAISLWMKMVRENNQMPTSIYEPVTIPMVRRVFPNLMASDIVGVQPMNSYSGQVFNMTYRFDYDNIIPTKKIELFTDEDFTM